MVPVLGIRVRILLCLRDRRLTFNRKKQSVTASKFVNPLVAAAAAAAAVAVAEAVAVAAAAAAEA